MRRNKIYEQTRWLVNAKRGLLSLQSFFLRKQRSSYVLGSLEANIDFTRFKIPKNKVKKIRKKRR